MKRYRLNKIYEVEAKVTASYRPFKDEKECLKEMKKHNPFGWIMNDYCTTTVCLRDCSISLTGFPLLMFSFDMVFKNFKFTDGTPFGIKED